MVWGFFNQPFLLVLIQFGFGANFDDGIIVAIVCCKVQMAIDLSKYTCSKSSEFTFKVNFFPAQLTIVETYQT